MSQRRWFNQAQPQTLQISTFLLYANSAFILFYLILDRYTALHLALILLLKTTGLPRIILAGLAGAQVASGFGIANERKWAYPLAIGCVVVTVMLNLYAASQNVELDILSMLFDIGLLVALVHPQSRDYQRIWFK